MDHLEKRLRRAEELLYYVISGNNKIKGKLINGHQVSLIDEKLMMIKINYIFAPLPQHLEGIK